MTKNSRLSGYIESFTSMNSWIQTSENILKTLEFIASLVIVALFAVGVYDLVINLYDIIMSGRYTEPTVVIGVVDTILLLFIIVELHKTVVAYARDRELKRIVTIVIYTGIIAVVRKFIILRTENYSSSSDLLLVAVGYSVLGVSLAALMLSLDKYTLSHD